MGVLCIIYHGNISTYSSLLNMDSAGLVQGTVGTGMMRNLAETFELPPIVKVCCTFLFYLSQLRVEARIFSLCFLNLKGKF